MRYFEEFSSNSTAGSGNPYFFCPEDPEKKIVGRTYYRITFGGEYRYSLLYSNLIDSTFADGNISHCNLVVDEWMIHGMRIGLCDKGNVATCAEPEEWVPVTFDRKKEKQVAPGEIFATDPVTLNAKSGEYLCVEMTFSGKMLPCHPESVMSAYVDSGNGFARENNQPFASMIGCDRKVKKRLVFLGDSITQGIGTPVDSYEHWCARVAEQLGEETACWDIGLGYGRAADAATGGAWLFKARQSDAICVCFGVNDLEQTWDPERLEKNLRTIVNELKKEGKRVLVQTVPPFDYPEELRILWNRVNRFIKEELAGEADTVFDVVPILGQKEKSHMARYGGHPDGQGCAAWANALVPVIRKWLEE